jgi:hypothetical protein
MPSKNSLAGLKTPETKAILPANTEGEGRGAAKTVESPEPNVKMARKTVGRPKLDKAEKRDYKITLSLTQTQGRRIKEKAGLVNEATYLYDALQKQGIIE